MPVLRRLLPPLFLTLAATVPASAAPAPGDLHVDAIEARLASVRAPVSLMRAALAEGTVASAVRAGAIAAGREDALEDLPAPGPASDTLADAVAEIVAAVRHADSVAKRGPAAALPGWVRRAAAEAARSGATDLEALAGVEPVSAAPALRAAALVARAVDRAMPALEAAAAALPPELAGADCDIIDQDAVCVGGTGANTHVRDVAVSIDLGGDDTYTHDAGFVAGGAQLVLDLTGKDLYAAETGTGHAYVNTGGVAMLVDGAGDDSYLLESTSVPAGGQAVGILGGVGVIVDGAGNDVYRQRSEVDGGNAGAGGMGEGVLGGVGVMVDGGGDDTYSGTAVMHPVPGSVETEDGFEPAMLGGYSLTTLGGVGIFGGAGLLADAGGTDSFVSDARMASAPPEAPHLAVTFDRLGNIEQRVAASGWGLGSTAGVGYLLEGPGATEYALRAAIGPVPLADPNLSALVLGQGNGVGGSIGAVSDLGGADRYTAEVSTLSAVARSVDDNCDGCAPPTVDVIAAPAGADVQGFGGLGSVGVIDDAVGDDIYEVRTANGAVATAHDGRTEVGTSRITGGAAGQPATVRAQGASFQGVGVVWDAAGDDAYRADAETRSEVEWTAVTASNEPNLFAFSGAPSSLAQGVVTQLGGAGALVDLGGSDSYEATAAGGSVVNGAPSSSPGIVEAQAAAVTGSTATALLLDLDGVGADTFVTVPETPACRGARGESVWQDCGSYGIGING